MSRQGLFALPILLAGIYSGAAESQNVGPPVAAPIIAAPGSTLRQADARVAAIIYRFGLTGIGHCPVRAPLTGMLMHHLAEYEPADRVLMTATYGLDRGPGVLTVLAGSPAAFAGLVAGDVLLAVNGTPFLSPVAIAAESKRRKWRKQTDAGEIQLEEALRIGPARLTVLREGKEVVITLDSLPGCPARVRLARSSQTNAFASGRSVVMTTSMLAFVRDDSELAVVLGHELAHNILRHPVIRDEEGVPDEGLLRALGLKKNRIWRSEEQADRLGLRLMAAAGYDLAAAIPFWRRYLRKYDWFPQIFRSHPSLGAREGIAAEEIAAIQREAAAVR